MGDDCDKYIVAVCKSMPALWTTYRQFECDTLFCLQPMQIITKQHCALHLVMATLCSTAGHYIFVLWFLLLSIFYFLLFFLTYSQLLRMLDVYHTSTHGVVLVRIQDTGLKRAVHFSLKIQDAKNRQKFDICTPLHNFVGLYLHN